MNSWLVLPLEVLPGWPDPEPLSTVHLLAITVLGPLAVGLVIAAITWAPRLMKRSRSEAAAEGLGAPDSTPALDSTSALDSTPAASTPALDGTRADATRADAPSDTPRRALDTAPETV